MLSWNWDLKFSCLISCHFFLKHWISFSHWVVMPWPVFAYAPAIPFFFFFFLLTCSSGMILKVFLSFSSLFSFCRYFKVTLLMNMVFRFCEEY